MYIAKNLTYILKWFLKRDFYFPLTLLLVSDPEI